MVTLQFMACWPRFLLAATRNSNSTSHGQRPGQRPLTLENACQCYGLRSYGTERMLKVTWTFPVPCYLPHLVVVCGLVLLVTQFTGA